MPSDKRIYDAYIASRQSAALAAAVRLGVFEALAQQGCDVERLAQRLELSPRPTRLLLRTLQTMGLVQSTQEGFALAEDAAAFLVRGKPGWVGGLIDLEVDNPMTPALLLEALKRDGPSVYGSSDPWQAHAQDPQRASAFTAAMHSISEGPAAALAELLDLPGASRVLDVGGGSGALSIALARRTPGLECTIWDLPSVCELARGYLDASGLADQVSMRAGDIFQDPFPEDHDAILFSQILHDWSPETGDELLSRAWAALPAGGRVIIHEKLIAEDGSGPLANALVDLDMLVWTEGQQWTQSGLHKALEAAGFDSARCRATTGYWSVVDALKPS
ncbi:MAG: methyltransferase domain-containing protein [bacterium]|nr:methyltransferase domain-containing protein [bacterium]